MMTKEEMDALVKRAEERHRDRAQEEQEAREAEAERDRQAYMRRTGRRAYKP